MSARSNIYNAIKDIVKVEYIQNNAHRITQNTACIIRQNSNGDTNNSRGGWDYWSVYLFSPHNPNELDELRAAVISALMNNGIEVQFTSDLETYDYDLRCYVTSVYCRTPRTLL